ncbi:MAG TPA: hypothetical protein VG897_15410 [Terriglobales bacterium]|nr:hypothetical protein [Terriglobales bacterium]
MNYYRILWRSAIDARRGFDLFKAPDEKRAVLHWLAMHGTARIIDRVQEVHENGDLKK